MARDRRHRATQRTGGVSLFALQLAKATGGGHRDDLVA
jgi:hypothetical protein